MQLDLTDSLPRNKTLTNSIIIEGFITVVPTVMSLLAILLFLRTRWLYLLGMAVLVAYMHAAAVDRASSTLAKPGPRRKVRL